MKKFFKQIEITSLIINLFYLILGIALIAWTDATKLVIIYVTGALLVVHGIVAFANDFIYGFRISRGAYDNIVSGASLLLGILFLAKANAIASSNIFATLFSLILFISVFDMLDKTIWTFKANSKLWWLNLLFCALVLTLGIVIIVNPFKAERFLFIFLGISFIITSIIETINMVMFAKEIRKTKAKVNNIIKKIDQLNNDIVIPSDTNNED